MRRDLAACLGLDPNLFVQYDPDTFQEIDPDPDIQAVCQTCAIMDDCREYAITHFEEGWWGGTSFRNRDRIRRKRRETNSTQKN
jgi:hypothetical protein